MEQIKAKQVGSNLNVIIDGERYTKSKITKEEVASIKLKIDVYNKKPSKAKRDEILNLVSKKVVEAAKKETMKKAIKKTIKKEEKKVIKSKAKSKGTTKTKDLVESVKTEFKEGNFSEEEIAELKALLKKKKEAIKEAPKPEIKQQDSSSSGSRERYR